MTTIRTIKDLDWNEYVSPLVHYNDGVRALWVTDEYLAGKIDDANSAERYTLNDENDGTTISAEEDIDWIIDDWKRAVEWNPDADEEPEH